MFRSPYSYWLISWLLHNSLTICSGSISFINEPMNITICEGRDATILCTYTGASTIPAWYINETNYSWSHIPRPHMLKWLSHGAKLTIDNVSMEISSTRYQCGFPTEGSVRSALGILHVESRLAEVCMIHFTTARTHNFASISEFASAAPYMSQTTTNFIFIEETTPSIWNDAASIIFQTIDYKNGDKASMKSVLSFNTTVDSPTGWQGRNTLIIAVTVGIVIIGLITLLSIIIFIVTCHRKKALEDVLNVNDCRTSPDHIYEEINNHDKQASSTNIDTEDKDGIQLHQNHCYENVLNSEIKLEKCLAYQSIEI